VVVGRGGEYRREVEKLAAQLGVGDLLMICDDIEDTATLQRIYRGASAFIYPSTYEGFGIPIIEAALCRVPVIAGDMPALREAGGEGVRYVDTAEPQVLAKALSNVLSDSALRQNMMSIAEGYVRSNFNGRVLSGQLLKLYEEARSASQMQ